MLSSVRSWAETRALAAVVAACLVTMSGCDTGGLESPEPEADPAGAVRLQVGASPEFSIEGPGDGEPPFHQITSALILANGDVAVADQGHRVVILDAEGQLLRSFGRSGDGPGEFRRLVWIQQRHDDAIVAYDADLGRASVFSVDGELARTIMPEVRPGGQRPPRVLDLFADGPLLAAEQLLASSPEGGSGIVRPSMVLSLHDPEGVFVDSLTVVPADERAVTDGVLLSLPFLRATSMATDGDRVHLATGDRFEFATYARDGSLVRTVREEVGPRQVTEELLEVVEVPGPLIPLLPATLPAVSDLIADPLGRVWVGPYVIEGERADVAWKVFGSGGDVGHDVLMPAGFRPLDVGESSVVGVWTDELDVEHVRLYPLVEIDSES